VLLDDRRASGHRERCDADAKGVIGKPHGHVELLAQFWNEIEIEQLRVGRIRRDAVQQDELDVAVTEEGDGVSDLGALAHARRDNKW